MKGLYINFPFCRRFCKYCDFYKEKFDEDILGKYIEKILSEIEKYKGTPIDTIYFGGGSPSLLNKEIEIVFDRIYKDFNVLNPEITIEVNPEDVNKSKIELWKSCGINRISFGVQTFNEKILKQMGRNYTRKEILRKYELLTGSFENINIDLIFSFPQQNIRLLKKDLEITLSLKPKHISTYVLSWGSPLMKEFEDKKNSEDEEYRMYNFISETLKKAGYIHYEISNFALKGYESRHNLKYWLLNEWLGIGAGAAGCLNGAWYKNKEDVKSYIEDKEIEREERKIDEKDKIIMGLRTLNGIRFNKRIEKMIGDKRELFEIENNRVRIKEDYWFVSNSILSNIIY